MKAKPIPIGKRLISCINACDGVFAIHDDGDGRFESHIGDARGVGRSDGMLSVDDDMHVQVVVGHHDAGRCFGAAGPADNRGGCVDFVPVFVGDDEGVALDAVGERAKVAA